MTLRPPSAHNLTGTVAATTFLVCLVATVAACAPQRPSEQIVRPGQHPPGESDTHDAGASSRSNTPTTSRPSAQPGELRQKVVAVNGESLTRGEFEARMNLLPEYARVRYRTLQARQSLLSSVIRTEAMADIAERRGLGSSTEARYAMQHELARQALDRAVDRQISMAAIDEQDIASFFDKHRDDYQHPERRRLAVIITGSQSRARALRRDFQRKHPLPADTHQSPDKAIDARIDAFRRLAASRSIHRKLPARGGDPGALSPPNRTRDGAEHNDLIGAPDTRKRWADVAFKLQKPGALSSVFDCPDAGAPSADTSSQWCLGMLIEILPADTPTADERSRDIRSKLYNQRVQALRTSMLEKWHDNADIETGSDWSQQAAPPSVDQRTLDDIPLEVVPSTPSPND
jgi:hypothetical protein